MKHIGAVLLHQLSRARGSQTALGNCNGEPCCCDLGHLGSSTAHQQGFASLPAISSKWRPFTVGQYFRGEEKDLSMKRVSTLPRDLGTEHQQCGFSTPETCAAEMGNLRSLILVTYH